MTQIAAAPQQLALLIHKAFHHDLKRTSLRRMRERVARRPRPCMMAADPSLPFQTERSRRTLNMKLVRYGAPGREKPGIIGEDGKVRDLSRIVKDIDGAMLT